MARSVKCILNMFSKLRNDFTDRRSWYFSQWFESWKDAQGLQKHILCDSQEADLQLG